jgi:hypothetical protein
LPQEWCKSIHNAEYETSPFLKEFSMARRNTTSAVAPKRQAIKRGAPPKTKTPRAEAGKRGAAKSIHLGNDMTIADGPQRMSVLRLFCESLQGSTVQGRRTPFRTGLSLNKIRHDAIGWEYLAGE